MLFIKTERDSLIPITSVKALRGDCIILLTGERINGAYTTENLFGTEDMSYAAIFNTMAGMAKELEANHEQIKLMRLHVAEELKEVQNLLGTEASKTSIACSVILKEAKQALDSVFTTQSNMREASSAVRELGETLNGALRELETQIAAENPL